MAKLSEYRIVIAKNALYRDKREAAFLKNCIRLVTGLIVPIVTDDEEPQSCELVIGETSREILDSQDFERELTEADVRWSLEIRPVGDRVYLTGLGRTTVQNENDAFFDNGPVGTDIAVKIFIENVLGYKFIYAPYDSFTEKEDPTVDGSCAFRLDFREIVKRMPPKFKGTSMYSVQGRSGPQNCFIFKTRSGKLVVMDGGNTSSAEHILNILTYLSDGKKPIVSAWFISHLHPDHYNVYRELVQNEKYRGKFEVENLYYNFLPTRYYTELAPDRNKIFEGVLNVITNSDKLIGVKLNTVNTGDIINVDELKFKILHVPDISYAEDTKINDSSVIIHMTVDNDQSVLFLGDGEHYANEDLILNHADEMKSDMVQVGHHGVFSVSRKCYELAGAKKYLFPTSIRLWYCDLGRGYNSGWHMVHRNRSFMRDLGATADDLIHDGFGMLAFEFPIKL